MPKKKDDLEDEPEAMPAPAVAVEESQDVKDTAPLVTPVAVFDEPVTFPDLPEPPAQAPDTVRVHNRSGQLLTIKSRGSILFPPGATEEVSAEEAFKWAAKGWVTIRS